VQNESHDSAVPAPKGAEHSAPAETVGKSLGEPRLFEQYDSFIRAMRDYTSGRITDSHAFVSLLEERRRAAYLSWEYETTARNQLVQRMRRSVAMGLALLIIILTVTGAVSVYGWIRNQAARQYRSEAEEFRQKAASQLQFFVLGCSVDPVVAIGTSDVPPELMEYTNLFEKLADVYPPIEGAHHWKNPRWLVEWARSANLHWFSARHHGMKDAENHWREEGLKRIQAIYDAEKADRESSIPQSDKLVLPDSEKARLTGYKAQFLVNADIDEKIQLAKESWELSSSPTLVAVINVNNWAYFLFQRFSGVSKTAQSGNLADLDEARRVANIALEAARSYSKGDRDIPLRGVRDTMFEVLDALAKARPQSEGIRSRKRACQKRS